MQKIDKSKKDSRLFQMKYPAPYSKSWAGMGHPRRSFILDKNSIKTMGGVDTISKQFTSGIPAASSLGIEPQPRFTGLDPTVPHLKYGLFPKKIYISRGQSRILSVKPSVRTTFQADDVRQDTISSPKKPRCITEPNRLKVERPAIAKASTVQRCLHPSRAQVSPGEVSEGPVFVFRPLEHRNLRSLTISASTHLDIKPRPLRGPILSPQLYKRYI